MKKIISGNVVRFTFDDEGVLPIEFDCLNMSEANRKRAVPFGMGHRLGDMAAIPKSEANGFRVTDAMRRAEIEAGIAHYESGTEDWNLRATAKSQVSEKSFTAAIQMIADLTGVSFEEAKASFMAKMAG